MNFKYLYNRRNRNSRRRKKKANCKDSEDSDDGPRRGRCKSKFIRKIVLGELGFFYYPIRAPPPKFDYFLIKFRRKGHEKRILHKA